MPDLYDGFYPGEVAGHVEAGAFITDDAVRTTEGLDEFFTGNSIDTGPVHRVTNVGSETVNRQIGEAVDHAKHNAKPRESVNLTGHKWRCGSFTFATTAPIRLVVSNPKRKDVVVTNQGTVTLFVGGAAGVAPNSPDALYLPPGSARTFEHDREIWAVGPVGAIVDFSETTY